MDYSKDISFVIPLYNEEESLPELVSRIRAVALGQHWSYEIIMVDDGSTDGSWKAITALSKDDDNIHGIRFRRNYASVRWRAWDGRRNE